MIRSDIAKLEGLNHFEMAETLGNPFGLAGRAALEQMGLSLGNN